MLEFIKELGNPHTGILGSLTLIVVFIVAIQAVYKFCVFWYQEFDKWRKNKNNRENKLGAVDDVKADNKVQDERLTHIERKLRVDDVEHRLPRLEDQEKVIFSKMNDIESCVSAMSEIVQDMRTKVNDLSDLISNAQQNDELVKQKVAEHEDSIIQLSNTLNALNQTLESSGKDTRDFIVSMARSAIYGIYKECRDNKYITKDALFTFKRLCGPYERAGGNDIVHDHIKPYIMSLPIKDYDDNGVLVDYAPSSNNLMYRDRSDSEDV